MPHAEPPSGPRGPKRTLPPGFGSDGTPRGATRNIGRDPLADPREAIRQWILDARLAGGVHGDRDMSEAFRSARVAAEELRRDLDASSEFFFDIGVQYLCAYMVAMANEPGDDVKVDVSQESLADLATRQADARVRDELVRGTSYENRIFSASLSTLRMFGG